LRKIVFLNLPGRLATAVLRLSQQEPPSSGKPKVTITQRELSQWSGFAREHQQAASRLAAAGGSK
jgi:hypothetical protein